MNILYLLLTLVFLALFIRNIFMTIFHLENYNIHKKRLAQIRKLNGTSRKEMDVDDLVNKVTQPVIKYILPKIKIKNYEELECDLRLSGWDKHFNPTQFISLSISGKILGAIVCILLLGVSLPIALIWGGILGFAPNFLLSNSVKSKKEKLMSSFPDFIRIIQGYLTAGFPFVKSVEETMKYVSDEWQDILKDFIIDCNLKSTNEALDGLKYRVDIFEVREFVALIKLTLEQGGNIKEGFEAQANKIQEMQEAIIAAKIAGRQTMAIILQGPLLLCNMMIFGLPTLSSMMTMM